MLQSVQSARGPAMSVTIHCAVVALLFLAGANHKLQQTVQSTLDRVITDRTVYSAGPGGGGGGKQLAALPASQGACRRSRRGSSRRPAVVIQNRSETADGADAGHLGGGPKLPPVDIIGAGRPAWKERAAIGRPGKGGGIGDGVGTGIGPGKGPGAGPGEGGDTGGGLRGFAGAFTAPVVLFQVEPEFSEDARKAKLQGVVMLYGEVDTNGRLRNIRVTLGLGLGGEGH
jgi:protein TonB